MNKEKVNRVIEQLLRAGFNLTAKEFFDTTVDRLLKKYGVEEKLSVAEYAEVVIQLMDVCAEIELRRAGIEYMDNDDWLYK